jgi:ferrochelatase
VPTRHDAVLLIAFGGPERAEDVRPFLDNVLRGRPVPRARYEEVVRHYQRIGGRSPLNALTVRQAEGLRRLLRANGPDLPVYVGMRNWTPSLAEAIATMQADGVRHALGIILAAHRTEASWERYVAAVDAARAAIGPYAPTIDYASSWFAHPRFIEAIAERTTAALRALTDRPTAASTVPPPAAGATAGSAGAAATPRAETVHIVFTAHSVPVAMAARSPYVQELETSCRLVAAAVGAPAYTVAYQSRSGGPGEPWLEPDVNDVLRELATRGTRLVVIVPVGFVCDHVEVLFDLDVAARATADALGIELVRAEAANDHPAFLAMLAEVVRAHAGGSSTRTA